MNEMNEICGEKERDIGLTSVIAEKQTHPRLMGFLFLSTDSFGSRPLGQCVIFVHGERSRIILQFVSSDEVWNSSSELTQNSV